MISSTGGTATITASSPGAGGAISGSAKLTYRSRSISVVTDNSSIWSGSSANVTVQVKDASGGALAGQTVTLSGTDVSFGKANGTTDSSGKYKTTFTSTTQATPPPSRTITASSSSAGGTVSASASFTVKRTLNYRISVASNRLALGETTTASMTVQNSMGYALAGVSVKYSVGTGLAITGAQSGTTNSSGVFSTTVRRTGDFESRGPAYEPSSYVGAVVDGDPGNSPSVSVYAK
ncbi:Ig-like domain-containing protein [Microbacterium sp. VKM Ac-2923]|uniref:Ig-like domain-containing protein n=1 Tax=Microbacterium sp. VKM Ac-2923 TaxID=2929476 RepID=UPI001FB28768|nr:Ig-like domain-containing protein [Microbacterium sp. VKM Ac-2923]MCJ1708839.1 Ig-like domain-containing protein [Microbacterium sp. VKM Ac-2923]